MTHQSDKRHVVLIGAGFGGVACVRKLARDPNLTVTLVDRRNHHLFQPLLYQVSIRFVHIAFLIDFRSRPGVLIDWFWAYVHDKPGSRVFTAPSETSATKNQAPALGDPPQRKPARYAETTEV